MVSDILIITKISSLVLLSVLLVVKVNHFRKYRSLNYHFMCLLYFPGIDIMLSGNSKDRRYKMKQNHLSYSIFWIALITLLLWFIG